MKIWTRVTRGIEWIAAAEASLQSSITTIKIGHRDVLFDCDNFNVVQSLRCIDDAFLWWHELNDLDHTRTSLQKLKDHVDRLPPLAVTLPSSLSCLRVTASFLGRRNYSRYEIEDVVGQKLAQRLGLCFVSTQDRETTNALWCRVHLWDDQIRFGYRFTPHPAHRRPWRTAAGLGAIHPPLAAAMALLADVQPGQRVIDPFCGSGTLLIETGLLNPQCSLRGYDINTSIVDAATSQAKEAQISLDLNCADAVSLEDTADCLLTNPPWNHTVQQQGLLNTDNLATTLIKFMRSPRRGVALADKDLDLSTKLLTNDCKIFMDLSMRIAGRTTQLILIGDEPWFKDTPVSYALKHAWLMNKVSHIAKAI